MKVQIYKRFDHWWIALPSRNPCRCNSWHEAWFRYQGYLEWCHQVYGR